MGEQLLLFHFAIMCKINSLLICNNLLFYIYHARLYVLLPLLLLLHARIPCTCNWYLFKGKNTWWSFGHAAPIDFIILELRLLFLSSVVGMMRLRSRFRYYTEWMARGVNGKTEIDVIIIVINKNKNHRRTSKLIATQLENNSIYGHNKGDDTHYHKSLDCLIVRWVGFSCN